MRRCVRLLAWALPLVLAGSLWIAPATADDTPPQAIAVPTGRPIIQIDGTLAAAEWEGATRLPLSTPGAFIRVLQARGTLFLALEADQGWTEGGELLIYVAPEAPAPDYGAWSDGSFTIRYEPLHHDRPHVMVSRMVGTNAQPVAKAVVARAKLTGAQVRVELALDLEALGVPTAEPVSRRVLLQWMRPGAEQGSAIWPRGVSLTPRPGEPPLGLVKVASWGTWTGVDARGPGALGGTQLERMHEEDAELTRMGAAAHALIREMLEERAVFLKQDARAQAEIFDAFDAIAAKESLAQRDHFMKAQALGLLNRPAEAVTIYQMLIGSGRPAMARAARYELARAYALMERFDDEAAAWEALAAVLKGPPHAAQYQGFAARARERAAARAEEQARRDEDDAKDWLPYVELVTNRGTLVLQVFADDVPEASAHFLRLVKRGFYDGLRFHRVIAGFVTQTGCPDSREGSLAEAGKGSSEESVPIEENKRHAFWRGAVAFAVGLVQSNGSQFFMVTAPQPDLVQDSGQAYTLFARVVSGLDVMDRLELGDTVIRARVLRPLGERPSGGDG